MIITTCLFSGCIFETEAEWGSLSTPGYVGGINYPNYVTCVWNINADEPIAIKFSDDTQLIDEGHSRVNNGDYLEVKLLTLLLYRQFRLHETS